MKILLYKWKVFNQEDIKAAFERNGQIVDLYEETEADRINPDSMKLKTAARGYDAIFSVNYFPQVSEVCEQIGIKYIAWTVDSPMIAMHHKSIFHACNYIFVFDKFNYLQFQQWNLPHLYYLPLAVDTQRIDTLLKNSTDWEKQRFQSEISFVGGMYHKNSYDQIKDSLTPYLRGYFDAAMQAQMDLFGENIFDQLLTVDILEQLCEIVDFKQDADSMSDLKLVFTSTFLGYKLAQLERIECLNRLARTHQVNLYTDQSDDRLHGVNLKGSVNYLHDMPKVFHESKINMNFTIRNIRSGIPLRVWDILGAGGFLLTNFQAELPAYFENEKDIVYYESLADMEQKASYYLKHEEERLQIAKNGYEKVKQYHSYDIRIKKILACVNAE